MCVCVCVLNSSIKNKLLLLLLTGRGIEGGRVVVGNVVRAVTSPVDVFFFLLLLLLLLLLMLILDRPSCTCLVQRIEGPAAARQRRALCVRNKCRPVGPRGASRRRRRRRRQQPVGVVGIVERFVRSQTPGSSVTLASCGRAIDAAQASVVWWWWWSKKRRGEREKMTKSRNKFIFHYFSSATPSSFFLFFFSFGFI